MNEFVVVWVCIASFLVSALTWVVLFDLVGDPSGAQVRATCVKHAGVAQVSTSALSPTGIVCRDGYFTFR